MYLYVQLKMFTSMGCKQSKFQQLCLCLLHVARNFNLLKNPNKYGPSLQFSVLEGLDQEVVFGLELGGVGVGQHDQYRERLLLLLPDLGQEHLPHQLLVPPLVQGSPGQTLVCTLILRLFFIVPVT